ncbi:MAG: AAA family ATPase [Bifidobacteriaceae bacterium]|jgi:DNA repair protein RecN (Recombination protein N)|nr:AAA family ATPase [Bifidobacteriaceae bacterium]
MLRRLDVSDLGVIGHAEIEFAPGFTVITGETGAGKTMLLAALGLLRGGKADPGLIRAGADRAQVEGVLTVADPASDNQGDAAAEAAGPDEAATEDAGTAAGGVDGLGAAAARAGAMIEDGELIVARSVSPGRSRAVLGGMGVPAGVLARLVEPVITVHGQSDQIRLRSGAQQRALLDQFAGPAHGALLAEYRAAHGRVQAVAARLERLTAQDQTQAREADALLAGIKEIETAAPVPSDDTLDARIARLASAEDLRLAAAQAHAQLVGADAVDDAPDASSLLAQAGRVLEEAGHTDQALAALAARLKEAAYQVQDVGEELASYLAGLDADPAQLEALEARRAEIGALRRKYGATVPEILAWAEQAKLRAEDLDASGERLAELRDELAAAEAERGRLAGLLTEGRTAAARRLETHVDQELAALAMAGAQLRVAVEPVAPGADGQDAVTFLLRPHPAAPERPLAKGASGGELSRIMLALEVALAGAAEDEAAAGDPAGGPDAEAPALTMVFDEVDSGVGGRAALEVGRRLARLARRAQVIVVTHLAQVAAFADAQVVVEKTGAEAEVHVVTGQERERELARMLGGQADSAAARHHARELLALEA